MKGIKLEAPYGAMIIEGNKKLIVSPTTIPWEERELYLLEGDNVIGKIKLSGPRGPFQADVIRTVMEEFHGIPEDKWDIQVPGDEVFTFMVEEVHPFELPVKFATEGTWIDHIEIAQAIPKGSDDEFTLVKLADLKQIVKEMRHGDLDRDYLKKKIELVELMQERVRRGMNGGT
ncbi:hypothetical protein KAR91_66635 [Candidatus Pacearchaeota archaeon]|nr:hypothetical protein [Candidatus Pacearchaeota archaeon]